MTTFDALQWFVAVVCLLIAVYAAGWLVLR